MKKVKLCLSIGLVLLFSLALTLAADSAIKFKQTELDFGELESGSTAEVKFEFENVGDSPLIIKNVSTSCGCTATKLDKMEYKPGEKGVIPTKFMSAGYSGKVIKTVTVTTNDPKTQHTILKISGEVKLTKFAQIELETDKIDFATVNMGGKYTQQIALRNPGTIDLMILELIHGPEITPQVSGKIIPANGAGVLDILFTPMATGAFNAFMKIRTNAHKQPVTLIKLSANVAEKEVSAKPKETAVKDDRP